MAEFERSIGTILAHEGGLVDHPNDPGGITNYGISMRFALSELRKDSDKDGFLDGDFDRDGDVDGNDIRKMNVKDAIRTYKVYWWDKNHYDMLLDQDVATKIFDCAVNMGERRANKLAQKAANACGAELLVDGQLGPKSMYMINSIQPPSAFVVSLCREQAAFYKSLAEAKPSLAVFLKGWLRRAAHPFKEVP
jgi:lysozyme family protein